MEDLVQISSKQLRDLFIDAGMETGMQQAWDAPEEVALSLRCRRIAGAVSLVGGARGRQLIRE